MSVLDKYNDAHRLFLQSIVDKSMFNQDEALKMATAAAEQAGFEGLENQPQLADFVGMINVELNALQMKITSVKSQASKETFYSLINQVDDKAAEYATESDKAGIEFYNLLIDSILEADGSISRGDAMLVARDVKAGKKTNAEVDVCIDTWIAEGWLEWAGSAGKNAHITLGPRALLELDSYMKSRATDELPTCPICARLAIVGERCDACHAKLCRPCTDKLAEAAHMRCPSCKETWGAARENDTGGAPAAAEEETPMEEDEAGPAVKAEPDSPPQERRTSRRSGRVSR